MDVSTLLDHTKTCILSFVMLFLLMSIKNKIMSGNHSPAIIGCGAFCAPTSGIRTYGYSVHDDRCEEKKTVTEQWLKDITKQRSVASAYAISKKC